MNPTKMRDTYGKLMYILMDTESHTIKSDLQFTFVKPILTVSIFLRQHDSLHILSDPLWAAATQSINNVTGEKSKIELATELQDKMNAEKKLKCKYTSGNIDKCKYTSIEYTTSFCLFSTFLRCAIRERYTTSN